VRPELRDDRRRVERDRVEVRPELRGARELDALTIVAA
jgi:hypothetical protein